MDNQFVTLSISSDIPHNYTSDIRVFNENTRELRQVRQVVSNTSSEVNLGFLSELENSYLMVETVAQKSSENINAKIQYTIKYGQTEVEKTSVESHFLDRTTAFFNFRFRFCPRHPFC